MAIVRYIKAFARKSIAAVAFVLLCLLKVNLKIFYFVYRRISIVLALVIALNAGYDLFHGNFPGVLLGIAALAVMAVLFIGLPILIPIINDKISHTKNQLSKPLVQKSRLKYTLG